MMVKMPIFRMYKVINDIPLEEKHGLISKEATYRSIEILIGPLQIQLGRRVEIRTYNV